MPDAMGGYTVLGDTSGLRAVLSEIDDEGRWWHVSSRTIGLPGEDGRYLDAERGMFVYPLDPNS